MPSMSPKQLRIVQFCAQECNICQSGEISVYHMVNAYAMLLDTSVDSPNLQTILGLGRLIEPKSNEGGFRTPVAAFDLNIPYLLDRWSDLNSTEWYREWIKIRPFIDGNIRVGAILYNWHRNTLDSPVSPPAIF
jgi:hypothetical protein